MADKGKTDAEYIRSMARQRRKADAENQIAWLLAPKFMAADGTPDEAWGGVAEKAARIFRSDKLRRHLGADYLLAELVAELTKAIMAEGDPVVWQSKVKGSVQLRASQYIADVCTAILDHYQRLIEATREDAPWVEQYLRMGYPITATLLADAEAWHEQRED